MVKYLFSNDWRVSQIPDILVFAAEYALTGKMPTGAPANFLSNIEPVHRYYLSLDRLSNNARLISEGRWQEVLLNFVNKFQYPNARTEGSYKEIVNEGIQIAPLREAVKLLYALNLIDPSQAYLSSDEIADFIFYNDAVAKAVNIDRVGVARSIIDYRATGHYPPTVDATARPSLSTREVRYLSEMMGVMEKSGCVKIEDISPAVRGIKLSFDRVTGLARGLVADILTNESFWKRPPTEDYAEIRSSCMCYSDTHLSEEETFHYMQGLSKEDQFIKWMRYIYGKSNKTANSYVVYLNSINKPYEAPKNSVWPGIYEHVVGCQAPKAVFSVDGFSEFETIYGWIRNALDGIAQVPTGVRAAEYHAAVQWAAQPSVKSKANLSSAYKAYVSFLKWFDEQEAKREKRKPSTSAGDLLTVALKMFEKKRKEEEWCSDKTDGDANKPRAGYVANKQLRVLSNTPADIGKLNGDGASNIKAWFKNYWNVADGKSWLEGLSDADLSGFGPYIAHLLQPGSPAVAKPAKFSNALEAAVKAVIKPEETGLYDERVNETLKFLGLIGFDWNENFDADDLGEAVNAQRVIKRRLKDMGLKRIQENPTADDGNAPDYLTVNEFLWFVKLNLNRIEKEVQEGKMKPAIHKAIEQKQKDKKPEVDIKDSEDVLLLRLRAALRTKPFAILAGHSGTGKSRMVRKLAYMTCNDNALRYVLDDAGNIKKDEHGNDIFLKEPGNFCMVQVKPNWHDSSDLLGYYSELGKRYRSTDFVEFICKAYAYPNTPFFVCLDEMNLAPVEQYFAEYLSAIESRKLTKVTSESDDPPTDEEGKGVLTTDELIAKSAYTKEDATGKSVMYEWLGCTMTESQQWLETYGLTIPRNLFVVGTVNMDETTNQFSRKVLDRAMTIEMTDADFDSFGAKSPELKFDDEYMGDDAVKEMLSGEVQARTLTTDQKDNLNALKTVLAPTSFAVAYRFANEYALYEESLNKTVGSSVKPHPPGTPEGTTEEVLTLSEPAAAAAAPAVPAVASPEAAESASAAEAAPAAEEGTAEGAAPAPDKKDPAIPSAFDDMVLMKVLPRISGDEADVKQIFYEGRVVGKKGTRENPADKTLMKILDVSKDTESLRKIAAILDRGGTYLSFWP